MVPAAPWVFPALQDPQVPALPLLLVEALLASPAAMLMLSLQLLRFRKPAVRVFSDSDPL
jgi:hypothetical protein